METTELQSINAIKHQATELRYRFETAGRACTTIAGVCWDMLGTDRALNDTQKQLLDNVRFEVQQLAEQAGALDPLVEHSFEAVNRLDKELK